MKEDTNFLFKKPTSPLLSSFIEFYFYIDIPVSHMTEEPETMIPFPRVTLGYFFDNPFKVVNHSLKDSTIINNAISRISTKKIDVLPTTERIRIVGAHMKPYGLAFYTKRSINTLPWLIEIEDLFGNTTHNFLQRIHKHSDLEQMFMEVEDFLLVNIINRDLSLVERAVELVEKYSGDIELSTVCQKLNISDRTLRNHFYDYVGCSPKEYIRIVRMKFITYQLRDNQHSLKDITYNSNFFDQAHFIHEIKNLTGKSPKKLRKDMDGFRFLPV